MKQSRRSKICASLLLLCLSGTQVFAQTTVKTTATQQVGQTAKQGFVDSVNAKVTLNVLHSKEMEYKDWIKYDLNYLANGVKQNNLTTKLLNTEIEKLHIELASLKKTGIVTLNGATVEPYYITANKDAIMYAIEVRENMLKKLANGEKDLLKAVYLDRQMTIGRSEFDIYDKTAGNNPLSSDNKISSSMEILSILYDEEAYNQYSDLDTKEIDLIAGVLHDVLTTTKLPKNLVKNVKFYIAPYRFFGYKGFTVSANLIGRDEEVFIGIGTEKADYYSILDTILHELGHVYQADLLGSYSGAYSLETEIVQNFPKWSTMYELLNCQDLKDFGDSESRYSYLAESIAEHFRVTMYKYLGFNTKSASESMYPYITSVEKFILDDIKNYPTVPTYYSIPDVIINGESIESHENNSKRYETYKLDNKGNLNVAFNTENKNVPLEYDILIRVGNSADYLVKNKPITTSKIENFKLDKGEYAILIHSDSVLYRHFDFHVE